jgi:ubiquinone/menaquinone biosynthesis C-methylase UbiE
MTYYDDIADGYSELHGAEQSKKARMIATILHPAPEETLLDVGCGDGSYLELFDCKAVGIDPSQALIDKYKGKHKVMLGAAEKLPFNDAEFDNVISITAIQNFEDIEKGLKEIERVGRGKFALSYLKKSPRAEWVDHLIRKLFFVVEVIEEDKDFIFICRKKLEGEFQDEIPLPL